MTGSSIERRHAAPDLPPCICQLVSIFAVQLDTFEDSHDDLQFSIERARALQVLVRTMGMLMELVRKMGEAEQDDGIEAGETLELRQQLARSITALVPDGEAETMAGNA